MDRTGSAQVTEDLWRWQRGEMPVAVDRARPRTRGRPTRLPLGELVQPVVALAVLAALERTGGSVRDPLPTSVADVRAASGARASIADMLACPGPTWAPVMGALLRYLTGRSPRAAVTELVTEPLAVDVGFGLDPDGTPRGGAAALGSVLRAWLRLTQGEVEPALDHLSPAMVRRAWAAASRLVPSDGSGPPAWHGPGFVRNVGAILALGASPLAFGRITSGPAASGLALCDPCAGAVLVVLRRPGATAGDLRARADAVLAENARAGPRARA